MPEPVKNFLDWMAGVLTVASLLQWLPAVAAGLSVIWGVYRIYESYLNSKLLKQQLKLVNQQLKE